MLIKTTCPQCASNYQVDAGLKGKRMRCPNAICRAVFDVRDAAEAVATPPVSVPPVSIPTPAKASPRSGAVGELVPILAAELAAPPTPKKASLPAAEPPARPTPLAEWGEFFAGAAPVSLAGAEAPTFDGPDFASVEAAPPVRQGLGAPESNGATPQPAFDGGQTPLVESPRRRRILPLLLVFGLLTGAGVLVWQLAAPAPSDEAERFARAQNEYKDRNFGEAAVLFGSLLRDFPDSEQRPTYQFLAELSDIREPIYKPQVNVDETRGHLERLSKLLETYQNDPLLARHRDDVAESLYRLVDELTAFAARNKDRPLLLTAKRLNDLTAKKFKPAPAEQAKGIETAFAAAETTLVKEETRQYALALLTKFQATPTLAAIEQAKSLLQQPDLANDSEIKAIVDELPELHRKSILFRAEPAPSTAWKPGDNPPSVAVVGQRPFGAARPTARPVLALVRGVLYALDPGAGSLRWTSRVGIDTTAPPLWLPGTAALPPVALVLSSEAGGLLALDGNDGSILWRQRLPEPCQSAPALVGNHAFVACRSGAVFEIDLASGRRVGIYDLGQPLTWGGVLQPATDQIYFVGQRGCIFALDVSQRQCASILYTGHPSGALHCPPVIVPLNRGQAFEQSKSSPAPSQLLLCQEDKGFSLGTYALPFTATQATAQLIVEKVPGRVWFPPLVTPEHISVISDAGALGIFGLRQSENRDAEVFTMVRQTLPAPVPATSNDRPMVVYADSQNFWVLSHGQLHLLQAALSAKDGWKIAARISLGPVGSPVHAAQIEVDANGRTIIYVVTESMNGRAGLVTAVDLDGRDILWQRHLGLIPQGSPVLVGGKVLVWDQGGVLLTFDSQKSHPLPGESWRMDGTPVARQQSGRGWLLPKADGKTAIALAVHNTQTAIWKSDGAVTVPVGGTLTLDAQLGGTPASVADSVVLPLANGRLVCLSGGKVTSDDLWRSADADPHALGHAAPLDATKVICTDGSKGLTIWRLDGATLTRLKTVKLKSRIASAAALPANGEVRVCIADVDRRVTLLQGDDLRPMREWVMSDAITAGPFVRDQYIVVIVGGRRLVWLDPSSDKPQAYTFRADIIGEPQLIGGHFIVADESGQIQALDPVTPQLVGLGYTLHAEATAAAAPVAFGNDRLFVPLTDGTVLLPSRDWFRAKFLGVTVRR